MIVVAHMIGDYFLQNNWMAMNKDKNHMACLVHCLLYTSAVALICNWMDWRLAVVFVTHYIMDHWKLAMHWRKWFSGDTDRPWVITADNAIHLLILYVLR